MPIFGATLLEESLVGSFFVVRESREDFGRHWAGGVRAGVVEGADGLVHPVLEGSTGGEGPVCGGPYFEKIGRPFKNLGTRSAPSQNLAKIGRRRPSYLCLPKFSKY